MWRPSLVRGDAAQLGGGTGLQPRPELDLRGRYGACYVQKPNADDLAVGFVLDPDDGDLAGGLLDAADEQLVLEAGFYRLLYDGAHAAAAHVERPAVRLEAGAAERDPFGGFATRASGATPLRV